MSIASAFSDCDDYRRATMRDYLGVQLPANFGDAAAEYRAARTSAGLFDRSDRGVVIVTGADRQAWLHNLLTNAIKPLTPNTGCYAFAIDVRGRTLFDCNVLNLADAIWLDIATVWLAPAMAHLERFHISEDVALRDAASEFARFGVAGPRATEIAGVLGLAHLNDMPQLASVELGNEIGRCARHDFCGLPGFEIFVPRSEAKAAWDRCRAAGAVACGHEVLDALRIEAGIPWSLRDLDEKVIPPETGQTERAISYKKGCYLGQEVIERMRSLGSPAKRLVRVETSSPIGVPTPLRQGGKEVGRITSLIAHPEGGRFIGLGYLSARITDVSGIQAGDPPCDVEVVAPSALGK